MARRSGGGFSGPAWEPGRRSGKASWKLPPNSEPSRGTSKACPCCDDWLKDTLIYTYTTHIGEVGPPSPGQILSVIANEFRPDESHSGWTGKSEIERAVADVRRFFPVPDTVLEEFRAQLTAEANAENWTGNQVVYIVLTKKSIHVGTAKVVPTRKD